ncbi:peptide ligase PGM1-related protein [Streptomyces sp. NPDC045714]|uniref:peptide ligase PGM1-related protein n=1 Tax=Streptomyces sp. NPDC045714 TaxID=3154913 RepID=UPI0033EBFF6F
MTENPRRPVASIHIESRECDPQLLERLTGATYFPERLLGATIVNTVLRGGGHVLYVTAPLIVDADQQVDYYVSLLSGGPSGTSEERRDARERVQLVSLDDVSSRWLSEKVLDPAGEQAATAREALRDFVKVHRSAGADARLSYFEPSRPLESLARELGVPGTQSSSVHIPRGSKHSSREIFAATGIPVAPGTGLCHSVAELAVGAAALVRAGHRRILLKIDSATYGGGLGNALLEVGDDVALMSGDALVEGVLAALPQATLVDSKISWDDFVGLLEESGVIAEAWIEGGDVSSPSFQGRLTEGGGVEAISTHDQVFGAQGQSYTGCVFPARVDYRSVLVDYGLRVGRALLELGVDSGEYGVDFLALRSEGEWRLWGCEVNLRATATKHPFTMASGLLGVAATHDGRLVVEGTEYVYQASDGIVAPHYRGLRPAQLIEAVTNSPLAYDPERGTGVVLHLMSSVLHYGKFGALCIGTDHAEAAELMRRLRELADTLASGGRTGPTIPHSQTAPSPSPQTHRDAVMDTH